MDRSKSTKIHMHDFNPITKGIHDESDDMGVCKIQAVSINSWRGISGGGGR
jgi:hypothetical protein